MYIPILISILSIPAALARPGLLGNDNNIGAPRQAEPEDSQVGTQSTSLLRLFLALQILNQASLSLLILTFIFGKSVKRHPTVMNASIIWIIVAIISSLLFYVGKASGPEPSWKLCAIQASLLDGTLPLGSTGILAFTYQLYSNITKPGVKSGPIKTVMLTVAPYIAFACFVALGAFSASHWPQNVSRDRRFFYCSTDTPLSYIYEIYTAMVISLTIGFAIAIALCLRRHWKIGEGVAPSDLQLLFRLAIFGIYVIISFSLSIIMIVFQPNNPFPDLFAASIGPFYAFVMASQPDVYRTWLRLVTRKHDRSSTRAVKEVFSVISQPDSVDGKKYLPSISDTGQTSEVC